jgi:acetylornithine deacetylase/succinyl-diaminopimelate desuccinylase-like protein
MSCCIRFTPTYLVGDELDMFHGLDEKISVENYVDVSDFYYREGH